MQYFKKSALEYKRVKDTTLTTIFLNATSPEHKTNAGMSVREFGKKETLEINLLNCKPVEESEWNTAVELYHSEISKLL